MPSSPIATERTTARSFSGWPPACRNLSDLMHRQTTTQGHAPFLTYYDDTSGERTEFSYATFNNWVAKTANLLSEEFDLGPGSRVALAVGPHWTSVVLAFACWRIGACAAPVPVDATSLLGGLLGLVRPDLVVAWEDLAPALDGPLLAVGRGFGGRLTADVPRALPYAEEVLAFGDDFDDPEVSLEDHALLVIPPYAGLPGDTPIVLDQGNLLAGALALGVWGGLSEGDRLISTGPMGPVEGLALGQLGPFVAGASSVLARDLDMSTFARKVRDERITWAMSEASMLDQLAAGSPDDLKPLRGFVCPAGAARSVREHVEVTTGLRVHVGHGVAAATCASTLEPADLDDATRDWIAGLRGVYAGSPTAWAEVAERDGELCVRGPVVMAGHADRPDLDEIAFAGGWLHTGDQGQVIEGPDGRAHVMRG